LLRHSNCPPRGVTVGNTACSAWTVRRRNPHRVSRVAGPTVPMRPCCARTLSGCKTRSVSGIWCSHVGDNGTQLFVNAGWRTGDWTGVGLHDNALKTHRKKPASVEDGKASRKGRVGRRLSARKFHHCPGKISWLKLERIPCSVQLMQSRSGKADRNARFALDAIARCRDTAKREGISVCRTERLMRSCSTTCRDRRTAGNGEPHNRAETRDGPA
jgi:hypothetical protein